MNDDTDTKAKRPKRSGKDDVIAELTQQLRVAREQLAECQERLRYETERGARVMAAMASRG